jgi:hypothetical protein
METQENFINIYKLEDLFNKTQKMLKYTWKNSLIVGACVFIPLSFLYCWILASAFRSMDIDMFYNISGSVANFSEFISRFSPFLMTFFIFIAAGLVMSLGALFVRIVVCLTSFNKIRNLDATLATVALSSIKSFFLPLILQAIIIFGIVIGISIVFLIIIIILTTVFSLLHIMPLVVLFAVVGYIAFICVLIWLSMSFTFAPEAVIYERSSAFEGIKKSFFLVKGGWWRVFGILFLVNIIISFAVSILTGPIVSGAMLPMLSKLFKTLSNAGSEDFLKTYMSLLLSFYSEIQIPLFISMALGSIMSSMVIPVLRSLFFIDLKVRKNELEVRTETPDAGIATEPEQGQAGDSIDGK